MNNLNSSNYNKFYTLYYDRCFKYAKSYVQNDLVAEDISAESLIKLWELSKIEEIDNPVRLLYVILKNKALDYLKHEKIKQDALQSISFYASRELEIRISTLEASNPDKIFATDIKDIIETTVVNLPKQTRMIFEMSRYKNMQKKEIADHFEISTKGVDYHITKALSALRENLKDYFPLLAYIAINLF